MIYTHRAKTDTSYFIQFYFLKIWMIKQIQESLTVFREYTEEQKDLEPNTNLVLKRVELHASTLASVS